jgi:hypothetical protein
MFFALDEHGTSAHGRWVTQTGTGLAALARTREAAAARIAALTG